MIDRDLLKRYQNELANYSAQEILEWVVENFEIEGIALASSMGAEDQVLTDMILSGGSKIDIFTLDTGRLPEETYKVIQEVEDKYGRNIEVVFPESLSVQDFVNNYGINSFYQSIENRKECCRVRKIEPLKKRLKGLNIWITGLRKDQSITRDKLQKIEYDEGFGLLKLSPLADWSESDVWDYIKKNKVPYNKLHDKGYPSIGCGPCTRAVKTGDDIRSGRWWWEKPEHKECGIHIVNGKIVPRRK